MAPIDISATGILACQLHRYHCQLFFRHNFRRAYLVTYRFIGDVLGWKSISCDSFWGMFWVILLSILDDSWLRFSIGLVHFCIFHYRSGTLVCYPYTVIDAKYLSAWVCSYLQNWTSGKLTVHTERISPPTQSARVVISQPYSLDSS